MVVCVPPLRKAGSLTESANIESLDRLVLSTADICALVYEAGRMDSDDHRRAMQVLAGTGQGIPATGEHDRSTSAPVYVTDGALSYLQHANILRTVVGGISNVLIHAASREARA